MPLGRRLIHKTIGIGHAHGIPKQQRVGHVKTVVFAPMPMASVKTAVNVTSGLRRSWRRPQDAS
jgi:hypothetical protein